MSHMAGPGITLRLQKGIRHVCYEYVLLLAGFVQMTKPHPCPTNILVQDATLTHLRALAEFFWFRKGAQPGPPSQVDPDRPDLLARYYYDRLCRDPAPFDRSSNLMKALNRCVAHLTLSRDLSDPDVRLVSPWDGPTHLHGTAMLMLRTWEEFIRGVHADFRPRFDKWLASCAKQFGISLAGFESDLTRIVRSRVGDGYRLDPTP